ncbi:MAG: DUF4349 domain-containing protein [Jatrophihabitantaceae bacterium]
MPRSRRPRPVLTLSALAALALAILPLALSGCSSTSGKSAAQRLGIASGGAPGAVSGGAPGAATGGEDKGGTAAAPAQNQTSLQQRQIIRTATLEMTVSDVDRAARTALTATVEAGGRADTDDRSGGNTDRQAHLVLRVPAAGLDALLDKVVALGHENGRTEQGADVTTAVADVNARVLELQISVARLQDFLKHSGSIADLLALESQLTQRQSDLESTLAQQRALTDQVSLATLTVDFRTTGAAHTSVGPPGFGSAIRASLHALLLTGRLAVALLGYLAPFLLIAAVAGFFALRYRGRRPRGPQPDAVAESGTPAG